MGGGRRSNLTMPLATARWVVLAMYLLAVAVFPAIGASVRVSQPLPAGSLRLLPTLLLAMAAIDYAISLALEASALTHARKERNPSGAITAALLTGSFGCSFGVFGLTLGLLGMPGWSLPFYALSFVHGLHLMIRWPSLEQVAAGESYDTEP